MPFKRTLWFNRLVPIMELDQELRHKQVRRNTFFLGLFLVVLAAILLRASSFTM